MVTCLYKKTFLKDLANLPLEVRTRIETLVFESIPNLDSPFTGIDVKKLKGYKDYYRIRVGNYRIGFRLHESNKVVFYRVKSRADIYKVFP